MCYVLTIIYYFYVFFYNYADEGVSGSSAENKSFFKLLQFYKQVHFKRCGSRFCARKIGPLHSKYGVV